MSKVTTTIEEILRSEWARLGHSDFFDDVNMLYIKQGDPNSLMYQIARYTPEIQKLCNRQLFAGYTLASKFGDVHFKSMFVNRFLNREIKFQTLDMFRNRCSAMLAENDLFISTLADDYVKMAENYNRQHSQTNTSLDSKTDTTSHTKTDFTQNVTDNATATNTSSSTNRNRNADTTLPQDNTELDLNNDIVNYADTTHYDKGSANAKNDNVSKDVNDTNSEQIIDNKTHSETHTITEAVTNSDGNNFSPDSILKMDNVFSHKLNDFERALFLATW